MPVRHPYRPYAGPLAPGTLSALKTVPAYESETYGPSVGGIDLLPTSAKTVSEADSRQRLRREAHQAA